MNRPDRTGVPCISRGLTWNTTHTLKHNVFAFNTKKLRERLPNQFLFGFCLHHFLLLLQPHLLQTQAPTCEWANAHMGFSPIITATFFPRSSLSQSVCVCVCCFHQRCWGWWRRKPSLGSAGVPPRRQAPPLPLHSQSQHSTVREGSSVDVDWFTQQDTHFSGCPSSSWGLGGWRWTLWSWKKRNTPLCVCCCQHVCSLVAFQLRPGRAGQINLLQQMVAGSSRRMTTHLSFAFQASSLGNPFLFTLFSIFEDVHRTLDSGSGWLCNEGGACL